MGTHQSPIHPPGLEAADPPHLHLHPQVAGRWLTLRLASSRGHLVSPGDPLRLALRSIETRDGDLEFVLFWT